MKQEILKIIEQGENETNAIVHRDYREGVHSQFRVYYDKLVFWNVGKLPYDLSIEDIKKGTKKSYPRNKLIAEIFRDCGLIERYGSGVKKVIEQFREYGLKEPSFKEVAGGFDAIAYSKEFKQKKVGEKGVEKGVEISEKQRIILNLVKEIPNISKEKLKIRGGLTKKSVEYNIEKLKQKGLLKRIGPAKGGYWEVIDE